MHIPINFLIFNILRPFSIFNYEKSDVGLQQSFINISSPLIPLNIVEINPLLKRGGGDIFFSISNGKCTIQEKKKRKKSHLIFKWTRNNNFS